jgi:hypothetical protein
MRLYLQCIHDLEQCGLQVTSATESDDWLSVAMNGMLAEQYSRMLSAGMRDVRLWEAKQGWLVGPAPVSYERRGRELVETPQVSFIKQTTRVTAICG